MYRATHLFYESPDHGDESPGEGQNSPTKDGGNKIPPTMKYPYLNEEKKQLNSALTDPDHYDMISLSCFSRPLTKSDGRPLASSNEQTTIPNSALQRMGYNFELVSKQKESRLKEITEIESITKELASKDICIPNKTLQKAIIYDNERDIL